jgi:hypothetical protein
VREKSPKEKILEWSSWNCKRYYLDDFDELITIVETACDCARTDLAIETDKYTDLGDLEELNKSDDKEAKSFEIVGSYGDDSTMVSVEVVKERFGSRYKASAIVGHNDFQAQGILDSLREVLLRRKKWNWYYIGYLSVGVAAGSIVIGLNNNSNTVQNVFGSIGIAALAIGYFCLIYEWISRRHVIRLSWRKDAPPFFKRNRDALIINGVSFLLGALTTGIIAYILRPGKK